jgi:hypothetical protein
LASSRCRSPIRRRSRSSRSSVKGQLRAAPDSVALVIAKRSNSGGY